MTSFRVLHSDGSVAKHTNVSIVVDGGGVAHGFTDDRGHVTIPTSGTYGKVVINGRTVHQGSLNIGEARLKGK